MQHPLYPAPGLFKAFVMLIIAFLGLEALGGNTEAFGMAFSSDAILNLEMSAPRYELNHTKINIFMDKTNRCCIKLHKASSTR